ncbi:hypothetical protein [Mycobacterium sp. SMC-4]|uniref:hypothetical protein n=1 Tax=Mycobacterium sp. SMC-4 TaxID=2857059 RepID=UPI0021B3A8B8|nr:hypothetical protein [Mycobacterium sp. SMC-4]UXA18362.1 hypothetical protein KXD98_01100 [Mycobacterium sp. SMC-4]
MQDVLRRVLDYRMTVAEWIGAAVLLGTPYLMLGVIWAVSRSETFAHVEGLDKPVAIVGSVVFWPVLIAAQLCAL